MLKQKLIIILSIFGLFLPISFVEAGTILDTHKYAWSNNVGYISFASTTVGDSAIGGYAWSTNKGWINFGPALGGVSNDGAGNLSGSAWGEQLGWIDFDGVSINGSTGKFSGTATGELVGTITFDCPNYCDVETDWRQAITPTPTTSVTPTVTSSSGGSSGITAVADTTFSAQAKLIDVQRDGVINILDFNAMMVSWGSTASLAAAGSASSLADTNKDGVVDIFDFNTLMVYWSTTYQL